MKEGHNYFERDITRHEADLQETRQSVLGDIHNPDEITKRLPPQTVLHQRLVFPGQSK
jgi:hypothetical protein